MPRWFARLGTRGKIILFAVTAVVVVAGAAVATRAVLSRQASQACTPDMAYITVEAQQESWKLFWKLDCGDRTVEVKAQQPLGVSLSPDGQQVAYTDLSEESQSRQVFVADQSGRSHQFTHVDGEAWAPAWSPNDAYIGFTYSPNDGSTKNFSYQDIADNEVHWVGAFDGNQGVWSADGTAAYLVQSFNDRTTTIAEIRATDRQEGFFTTLPVQADEAVLSPDGHHLLFVSNDALNKRALYQYDLTTDSMTAVRPMPSDIGSLGTVTPDWRVYYGAHQGGSYTDDPPANTPVGIHAYDLVSGQDTVVMPSEPVQSVAVAKTGKVGPTPAVMR